MVFGKFKPTGDFQQSRNFADEGNWDKALEKLRLCLTQEPENKKYQKLFEEVTFNQKIQRKMEEGEELERQGFYQKAIGVYNEASDGKSFYSKQLKANLKRASEAIDQFEELVKQAQHLYQQEKYTKAKAVAQQIVDKVPHHHPSRELIQRIDNKEKAQMLYGEAMALYKRALFDSALKKIMLCLQTDPDFDAARLLLSKIGASQACENYQMDDSMKKKTKLQETIYWLESSIEQTDSE
ncbi:MAG: hypothetical protein HZA78_03335 [Candidatus Schekmanbacteria bacterium]|nr:hypothetical protein [Candidatus Schekmanbacteria bacterium]